MCGIVGYVGKKNSLPTLINCLKKLEYRGYDSSGIAYVSDNCIKICKEVGRISNLESSINMEDNSHIGIGHTRWATHGGATLVNAHPHNVCDITIVHNGIIENYSSLKEKLISLGYEFVSETDTEVASAYIDYIYKSEKDIVKALEICSKDLIGSFAIAMIVKGIDDKIFVIKKDSPMTIGIGCGEVYISSSTNSFDCGVSSYITLEDFDYGYVTCDDVCIYNHGKLINREMLPFTYLGEVNDKCGYDHYMLKEINEQASIIDELNNKYLNNLDSLFDISKYENIHIVACGSAYHAGIVGKYIIEEYSNINVSCYVASEYRYQHINYHDKDLVIVISQSGETADTIACIKKAKENDIYTLGIVNVINSTIARMVDSVIYTDAGVEVAVATTKGYLTQVYILILLVLRNCNDIDISDIKNVSKVICKLVNMDYSDIVKDIYDKEDIFYIGRNVDYATMLEGTLKLKEISYIHAECYAAGELKHGTISLITEETPVIGLITKDDIAMKTVSNIKEVKARGSKVILIVKEGLEANISSDVYDILMVIDSVNDILEPIVSAIPMQLIAYYVAKMRNCDIDKPRNLAKSVTVE